MAPGSCVGCFFLGIPRAQAANLMPGDGDGEVINCALDFTKATKKCMEEEAAAAAHKSEAAPASPPSSPTASPPAVSPAARRNGGARQAVLGERRAGVQGAAGLAHVKLKRLKRCALAAALCSLTRTGYDIGVPPCRAVRLLTGACYLAFACCRLELPARANGGELGT